VDHLEILDDRFGSSSIRDLFGYQKGVGLPSQEDQHSIREWMLAAQVVERKMG
jgi:hypothetical protein